jgi:hypothetical protein
MASEEQGHEKHCIFAIPQLTGEDDHKVRRKRNHPYSPQVWDANSLWPTSKTSWIQAHPVLQHMDSYLVLLPNKTPTIPWLFFKNIVL